MRLDEIEDSRICNLRKIRNVNYPKFDSLTSPDLVYQMMCGVFNLDKRTEEFVYILAFNAKRLNGVFEITHGSVDYSLLTPREVFARLFIMNSNRYIFVHNYPSGDPTPSASDRETFERLSKAGEVMNITAIDSIIIGNNSYYSFLEHEEAYHD